MKKLTFAFLALALAFAPAAMADTLVVDGANALAGAFGLGVDHDNSSVAYVQDNTPTDENVFRAEFLFRADNVNSGGTNFRQTIFTAFGPNPGQGGMVGVCNSVNAFTESIRCFHYQVFGGAAPTATCFGRGDFCGEASVGPLIDLRNGTGVDDNNNNITRFCIEFQTGAGNTGFLRFAVVDEPNSCASATYQERALTNSQLPIGFIRMGTPQTNGFGAGETADYSFDDYSSFRALLAP